MCCLLMSWIAQLYYHHLHWRDILPNMCVLSGIVNESPLYKSPPGSCPQTEQAGQASIVSLQQ